MLARFPDRHVVLLLIAAAIAVRVATFGNPIVHVDESFYLVVARAMWAGAVPYVDIWDRKPIGLFLIYLLPARLPLVAAVWAYQLLALAAVVGTALLVIRIARTIAPPRGAWLAGVAYVLWLNLAGGQGGQAGVFHNLPMAGAAALILANRARRLAPDAAAMLLVGVALQIKYSVVFEGVFFGLWVMGRQRAAGAAWGAVFARGTLLAAIALAPTAAAFGWYAAIGQGSAFAYANFTSITARGADPLAVQAGNLARIMLLLSPLIGMAAAVDRKAPDARFVLAWFGAALAGILVFGGWYLHYALPAMVPGAIAAAPFLGRVRARWGAAILGVAAAVGQGVVIGNIAGRGTPAEFAALTAAVGRGPGCLYVYSGTPMLYASSGRCTLSRWIFPGHLYLAHEEGAIGVEQMAEVHRILAEAPAVIVMRPAVAGERREVRAAVLAAVAAHYRPVARLPLGHETIAVYRRAE